MAANGNRSTTFYGGDLQDEKGALSDIAIATKAPNMTDCLRRMLRRIKGEMERQGITEFSESDIVLKKR